MSGQKLGYVGAKTRPLGQILEITCIYSRGHSFYIFFMKLCQTVFSLNLGYIKNWVTSGRKLGHKVKSKKKHVYASEGAVLMHSS